MLGVTRAARRDITLETVRRFSHLGNLTIARHLLANYPEYFESLEKARDAVRYVVGARGEAQRKRATIKKPPAVALPRTWRKERTDFVLPGGVWGYMSDVHIPMHEPKPIETAVEWFKSQKVTGLLLNGDILDFHGVGFWPGIKRDFDKEIEAGIDFLDFLAHEFPKVKIVFKPGNHECFDDQTEVLTRCGWLGQADITADTEVASLNRESGEIEFDAPLAIHRSQFDGKMFRIKSARVDLQVTPNHRMLHKRCAPFAPWRMDEMSSIPRGHNRVILPVCGESKRKDARLSDDLIQIAGWLLTDSHISTRGRPSVEFYQRPSKVSLITGVLDRLGWQYSTKVRQRNITEIAGRVLRKVPEPEVCLRLLGDSNEEAFALVSTRETMPAWARGLSDRQFKILLSTIVDGDGSRHPSCPETTWMVYKEKCFLDELQAIATEHGYRASLTEYRPGHWRMNVNPGTTLALDQFGSMVDEIPYSGLVWCVTTKNDTVVVRRNGRIAITGNSRLPRYFVSKAPELATSPLAAMETVLGFERRKIEFLNWKQKIKCAGLQILHGDEVRINQSVNPARGLFLATKGVSTLCGHVHKTSEHVETNLTGALITTWSVGCMCDLNPDYLPYNGWNWGCAIINNYDPKKALGGFEVENRRILPSGKLR